MFPYEQVARVATKFLLFIRDLLTRLDRWFAFITKFPREYTSSLSSQGAYVIKKWPVEIFRETCLTYEHGFTQAKCPAIFD